MSTGGDSSSETREPHQRLIELLDDLANQGYSQAAVATGVGIQPQYISDIKRGARPMTELVARRLADAFPPLNHEWLLGLTDLRDVGSNSLSEVVGDGVWLPLFEHPIQGDPHGHIDWNGSPMEVAGTAAARIQHLHMPYLLRFGHHDFEKRIRKKDILLMSQRVDPKASIQVVRYRKKLFLARKHDRGTWIRAANGDELSDRCPVVGHAVGIVWGDLL